LESDYYKGEMLNLLLRNPEHLSLDLVMKTAKTLESDYELAETLTKVSRENNLTGNQVEDFLKLANQLDSDYDFGRVMESLLKHQDTTPALARRIIVSAKENLDSDYELAQLLLRVNKEIHVRDDARLEELYLHAAQSLGSEWERGRVLDAAFGKGKMR
ncbi:MAG: hypothetical protein HKN21_15715, partial [Candidatus Eisenbacteria bacterium]|nr:hypothetical protein [Candidatus Eisenbacteria bacterium]